MAAPKTKAVETFQPITGFRPHPYIAKYPGDSTYCTYENEEGDGCPGVRLDPIHSQAPQAADPEQGTLAPLITWVRYMAHAAGHEFTIQQIFEPGKEPNNEWQILAEDFPIAQVTILENGGLQFHYPWMSNAQSVDGYDVVPSSSRPFSGSLKGTPSGTA